jgi:hypothetical protein
MPAVVALLVVLAAQAGFWVLLAGQVFLGALVANTLFWCVAFPAWAAAGRRWWRTSAAPDAALGLILIALTAAAFTFAQAEASSAAGSAWGWVGLFSLPAALIASLFATLRARALRGVTDSAGSVPDRQLGPKPVTVLVIAAVILAVALGVFAWLIAANVNSPR